ncbi:MAG: hypothetical protein EZS28_025753, partial [Streblomastix strix]
MERTKRVKKSTRKQLTKTNPEGISQRYQVSLEQFFAICQEMMKSVEKYIKDTHFASENDKQQAIEAAETKLHKEINELGTQNLINSIDISDCISALDCDYTNESQVDDVIENENIEPNGVRQDCLRNLKATLQSAHFVSTPEEQDKQIDEEQQGIDENLYDIHYDQLMIHNERPREMNTSTQSKPIISDDLDKEDWNWKRTLKQTLQQRTANAISKLYNYQKFNKGYVQEIETGKAIDISKCPYLAVVDIDVDKKLDESNRKIIRDDILQQLNSIKSLKVGLVQTAHGGIQIYCDMGKNKLRQNSMSGIIKSQESNPLNKRYGVDVFACVTPYNEEIQAKTLRWVVLPESRVKDKDSDIELQYTDLNHMWNIPKLSDISKVFNALNFDMNLILNDGKSKETKRIINLEASQDNSSNQDVIDEFAMKYNVQFNDSKLEMTKQTCILLCYGLKGLEIHNDAQELKKEITFLILFKSVNSLIKIDGIDEEFINDVYQRIKTMNNLTDSAKQHFDSQRERYKNEMTNPYILQGIIRDYNPIYYKDVVMKSIMKAKNDDDI